MKTNFEKYSVVIAALALSICGASAQIYVNGQFVAANTAATQVGAAYIGVNSSDVWNALSVPADYGGQQVFNAAPNLLNSSGTGSGLSFTATGFAGQGGNNGADVATAGLMNQWIFSLQAPLISTISGLSSYAGDSFNLVVYTVTASDWDTATINSGYSSLSTAATLTPGSANQSISSGNGYTEFSGVLDSSGSLSWQANLDHNAGLFAFENGFQLEVITPAPEPTSFALAAMGGIGMLTLIRRRKA